MCLITSHFPRAPQSQKTPEENSYACSGRSSPISKIKLERVAPNEPPTKLQITARTEKERRLITYYLKQKSIEPTPCSDALRKANQIFIKKGDIPNASRALLKYDGIGINQNPVTHILGKLASE